MKLKPQGMTAENLSVVTYQNINRSIVGTFINMLEKIATENNLSEIWEHFQH